MTTPGMGLDLPVVNVTIGPEYATMLNAALNIIDTHTHATGSGLKVTPAGLNINADLTIGSNNLTDINYAQFDNQVSTLVGNALVYFSGGDFYINNQSGTAVRITNGSSIDVSSLGTITGDFGQPGVTAAVAYDDTSKNFSFTRSSGIGATASFSKIFLADPSLSSQSVSITSSVSATAWTLTLPNNAATANGNVLVCSTAGVASFPSLLQVDSSSNITLNTNKFTVASATGNTLVAGTLDTTGNFNVNTNKFSVTASSGNTSIAGDLAVTGAITSTTGFSGNGTGIVPLGAIIAMTSGITGAMAVPASGVASNGWQRCDGAAIAGSQTLSGTTPNLSNNIFLMGSTTYGTTGGNNTTTLTTTQLPDHTHDIAHGHSNTFALGGTTSFASTTHTHGMDHVHQSMYQTDGIGGFLYAPTLAQSQVTSFTTGVASVIGWLDANITGSGVYRNYPSATGSRYTARPVDSGGTLMTSTGTPSATGTVTLSGSVTALGTTASGSAGTGSAYDSRPNFISVIWMLRVK